jgi:hypothetical protein
MTPLGNSASQQTTHTVPMPDEAAPTGASSPEMQPDPPEDKLTEAVDVRDPHSTIGR